MGVRLEEGRSIARGEAAGGGISIEVRGENLARVLEDGRVYHAIPLSSPAETVHSVFVPYKGFYGDRTDSRLQDVFRMLGKPLLLL
jgi:hypothetical protein